MLSEILDSQGMFAAAAGLPEQMEAAVMAADLVVDEIKELASARASEIQQIVMFGMGGSGMAGDIVLAVTGTVLPIPALVVKSYECPPFVGEGTLVFAVSASGDTEETIEATTEAALNGARVVAVTTGGELARLASGWGAPVIRVPPELPQPRSAVAAMSIPPMVVLEDLGLFRGARAWIGEAAGHLKGRRDQLVAAGEGSEAAALARRIGRTWPLIQGGGLVGAAAAERLKNQVNENAKAPAFWSTQPELCHNEVCGWGQHGDVSRQLLTLVQIRHDGEHPQVSRRFELVADVMREVVAGIIEVRAQGDGDLGQLFDLILMGDHVSLWMAAAAGIDPGPVPTLVELKERLRAG
ncbi:MAG: SIS domain-containing protein [Actinomycetota bacterium]|nr:SIS domain-containing protein [Actinomycetota bacterium]